MNNEYQNMPLGATVPTTDEEAELVVRSGWEGLFRDNLLRLYQAYRAQGKSVLRAWTETMASGAGVEVPEFASKL